MKYSKDITSEICKYIRAGNNYEDSASLADIDRATLFRWKKKYATFATAIKKAEKECKARNIMIIQKAAETNWTAAAWWLERKYSDEFALRKIQELQGKEGEPIIVKIIGDYASKRGGDVSSPKGSVKD